MMIFMLPISRKKIIEEKTAQELVVTILKSLVRYMIDKTKDIEQKFYTSNSTMKNVENVEQKTPMLIKVDFKRLGTIVNGINNNIFNVFFKTMHRSFLNRGTFLFSGTIIFYTRAFGILLKDINWNDHLRRYNILYNILLIRLVSKFRNPRFL